MARRRHSCVYKAYLASPAWQTKRKAALMRAGHRCQACGRKGALQVHHLTYVRLTQELPTDLVTLCKSCHAVADEVRKANNRARRAGGV